MRKVVLAFVLLVALLGVMPVAAQVPGPGGPYNSAFTVQNLDAVDGTCQYALYDSTGAAALTSANVTVQAGKSTFVYVGGLSVPEAMYSAVISCDVNVAAVSNYTGAGGAYAGSYSGVSAVQTATALSFPGLYKNYYGYYTNVVVQNAGSSSVDVTLKIYSGATLVNSETKTVPANASVVFDQKNNASLASGAYAGVVEATGPVAAMVNVWNSAGQQYAYNGFASGSAVAYAPVLMKAYYGFNTALTVQNVGDNAVDVTVTYSNGVVRTVNIPAKASQLFYTPNDTGIPNAWLGAAKIEAPGGSIVALVNESDANNRAASYTAFAAGSTTANAPIVLKKYYGYSTSITCQNIGGAATDITATYSNGSTETKTGIAAGATALFYQPNTVGLSDGFNGSAVITAAQPIVCVVNENQVTNTAKQDFLLTYEAIVQ